MNSIKKITAACMSIVTALSVFTPAISANAAPADEITLSIGDLATKIEDTYHDGITYYTMGRNKYAYVDYLTKNNCTDYLLGDVNLDGRVNWEDCSDFDYMLSFVDNKYNILTNRSIGLYSSELSIYPIDMDNDGKLTATDLDILERYVTAIESNGGLYCHYPHEYYTFDYDNYMTDSSIDLPIVMGDANRDDIVNARDIALMQQAVAGWNVKLDKGRADINADGKVDATDISCLQQYLAGWARYSPYDVNKDGCVNKWDIEDMAFKLGMYGSFDNYNHTYNAHYGYCSDTPAVYDINHDGRVNIVDMLDLFDACKTIVNNDTLTSMR